MQTKLVKMGGRLVRYAPPLLFHLAEVAVRRQLFAAVYLASVESRWVTGTVLTVDAGITATVPDLI